ncbi:flavodoxin [Pseudozobellia sp. WGM2]|uniref:flavodoxin family protein n=1 Tax=Pseudozobellia sp. WGM2 TaxID=2787625 RepID=UPI001AE0BD5D|nr:flavodoxin [Pseudozobellia sp. WGM2]
MNKSLLFFILFSFCFQNGAGTEQRQTSNSILIVYLSRTNNTKAVAEMIHNEFGGDLVAVELQNPYPENYDTMVRQVAEENASGFLPPLKTKVDMGQYDTIFFGFPTWGMQLPPPMKSFLTENDLEGKAIIPFNTNAGYGLGSSLKTIQKLSPDSTILDEFSVKGGVERDGIYFVMVGKREIEVREAVQKWLHRIMVVKN